MIAISVRNPFAFPFVMPAPLTGVLKQGQTIILPMTEQQFRTFGTWTDLLDVTKLPATYHGPFDWAFIRTAPTSLAVAQADWWVDYVTGLDTNPGTQALPLKTVSEIVRRWGTERPRLEQNTTIHVAHGTPVNAERVTIRPELVGDITLLIQGVPKLFGTFTLSNVTAKNRASATNLHIGGLVGCSAGQLVVNTTKGGQAIIRSMSGNIAEMTAPQIPNTPGTSSLFWPGTFPNQIETWADTDTVEVYDLPVINLRSLDSDGGDSDFPNNQFGNAVWFDKIWIPDATGNPGYSNFAPRTWGQYFVMTNCVVEPYTPFHANNFVEIANCWFSGGMEEHVGIMLVWGGAIDTYGFICRAEALLGGDVIVSPSLDVQGALTFDECRVDGQISIESELAFLSGVLWGTAGIALNVLGAVVKYDPLPWSSMLLVSGAITMCGLTTGSVYGGSGTFTDGVTISAANLDVHHAIFSVKSAARFCENPEL